MPNWCNNTVTIYGPIKKIKQLHEAAEKGELFEAMAPIGEWEYNKAVDTWGTKWDIDETGLEFTDHGDGTAEITGWFDSAWAPPLDAYDAFLDMMDNCYITASYHEGGMDFGGFYDNGSVEQCDDCYAQSKLPHDKQDDVFKRLDDEYNLSESYEMWDEDELEIDG